MRLPIFVLLLGAAFVGTAAALRLSTTVSDQSGVQFATALSAGTLAVWLLVTVSAFNVVTVSGGSTITNSYPSLGALGVVGAGVATLILGKGSLTLIDQ
jgi:uncharacterized protein GlcG (DUF336 family)